MEKTISAREAQSLRIREALLDACSELLAQRPIDAITINEIVDTAGVAKGSFYNHFPDKETLAAEVSSSIRAELEEAVADCNRNVTDPAYRIARGTCVHLQLAVADPRRAIIMLRGHEWTTSGDYPLNQGIRRDIEQGVDSGRLEERCREVGVLQLIGAVYFSMIKIVEEKRSTEQAIELAQKILTLILCGFGLVEEEASRIVGDSARDLITG